MKILLYGLNFTPEPTGIGKYSGEMAAWLSARGHAVRVIAAPPYYPEWKVPIGYSAWQPVKERIDGAQVWRTPLWVPARPSGATRLIHLMSFALFSAPALIRQMFWQPDIVMVVAPAMACAPGGLLMARLVGAKAWLHVQDFEVDAAFRMGLLKGKTAQRVVSRIERWILQRFDRVSTISHSMTALLRAKKVDESRIVLFPNWVDLHAIAPLQEASSYRRQLGIADDAVVALYSGSMTGKQGLDLLPAAARALEKRLPGLVLVLCGEGVYRPSLERDCRGLSNVRLLPLQPTARLGELLGMADIHLLPQQAQAADLVMPSKLTGMLASGRPTLTTALPGTELARVVVSCGIVVPPDDLTAFTAALVKLAEDPAMRNQLGAAARRYAQDHLSSHRVLTKFENDLRRCLRRDNEPLIEPKGMPAPAAADDETSPT